jgi:hypothetical protein
MFKFHLCAANNPKKNLRSPFSRTVALLQKRFRRTFLWSFSPANLKFKYALREKDQGSGL